MVCFFGGLDNGSITLGPFAVLESDAPDMAEDFMLRGDGEPIAEYAGIGSYWTVFADTGNRYQRIRIFGVSA